MKVDVYAAADAAVASEAVNILTDEAEKCIQIARSFLDKTCQELLATLDNSKDSNDRLIKIGRNIQATLTFANATTDDKNNREEKAVGALSLLAEECAGLAKILSGNETRRVPKVRYGKTEIQMPVVTMGCMRFQQSWNRGDKSTNVENIDQVDKECQENLVNILKHSIQMGVNHIETAKGYGCSEMQLGHALKKLFDEKFVKREDLIIQTKGPVDGNMTVKSYKKSIITQLQRLKIKYADLFSVHGLNSENDLKWLFNNDTEKGNLIDALCELQAEGKIRHIGFSTHGRADLIRRAIETDAFAYVNIHKHFVGSYTASGDSTGPGVHGNDDNVKLARSKDMGVFIISPYDKGGRLYAPSVKLRELTLPEFEPMEYGSLWLWNYHKHTTKSPTPMCHTIVCGAARPSDMDQPILASFKMLEEDNKDELLAKVVRVSVRLQKCMEEDSPGGKSWADSWHVGLPNWYHAKRATQHGNIVWLYNIIHAFGLLDFAKDRYSVMYPRAEKWDDNKSKEENVKSFGNAFNWMPGVGIDPTVDYSEDFTDCPAENRQQLKEAIQFVHKWCCPAKKDEKGEEKNEKDEQIPFEWETSYDMRPWTAFPERASN